VRDGWDRLGTLIGVSLTWLLLCSVPLAIGGALPHGAPVVLRYGVLLLAAILTLAAPTAGACYVAHLICGGEETSYLDLWRGAARFAGPAIRLGLIQWVVLSVLTINLWFYLHTAGMFGVVAALLCGYLLLFWSMMSLYEWPLLVAQEIGVFDAQGQRARRGALAVLRRSFFLALGRPLYTLGLLAVAGLFSVLCTVVIVLLPVLWAGATTLLVTRATRLLLVEFAVLPPPPTEAEIIPDEKFRIK
jgi:hypothetical protein